MVAESKLLTNSLKEWAVAVSALAQGQTIILLRKGGIREAKNKFLLQHQQVWLYPTYEHQKPQLLKPEYAELIKEVRSGWHPQEISIQTYAEITHSQEISQLKTITKLESYYVWQEQTIRERFKWKPEQPLTILFLKVFNLLEPVLIPFHSSYGGCKSWLNLQRPISTTGLVPVLSDSEYEQQVTEITSIIAQIEH